MAITVTATFTAQPLEAPLSYLLDQLGITEPIEFSAYNQLFQLLLNQESLVYQNASGTNIFLIRVQDWVSNLNASADSIKNHMNKVIEDLVEGFGMLTVNSSATNIICLCPSSFTFNTENQTNEILTRLEDKLVRKLSRFKLYSIIKSQETKKLYPVKVWYDEYSDRLGNIPYTDEYFSALSLIIARRIHGFYFPPYKVIAVDCDNTLWSGVCGEVGAAGVVIGKEHLYLQSFLIDQAEKGKLICLCTKNNEKDVLAVFSNRSDMLLKQEHITSYRINWKNKSSNLQELSEELGLGLDSFIFIDDNPMECAEVESYCPEVLTIQIFKNREPVKKLLNHVWGFDCFRGTEEDRYRTLMYQQEANRKKLQNKFSSFEVFLKKLNLEVNISLASEIDLPRISQLSQRTNQFNLNPRSYTEAQVKQILASDSYCLTVSAKDIFGDYGMVGVVIFKINNDFAEVDTFLLSCRALGKGIEHRIVNYLGKWVKKHNLNKIKFNFKKTDRNEPIKLFLDMTLDKKTILVKELRIYEILADSAIQMRYKNFRSNSSSLNKKTKNTRTNSKRVTALTKILSDIRTPAQLLSEIGKNKRIFVRNSLGKAYVPPHGPTHVYLVKLWERLLRVGPIGIEDNFFELAGDSLIATFMAAEIYKTFSVQLSLVDIFSAPTIEQLSTLIEQAKISKNEIKYISPRERYAPKPMSYAQQRLWFLNKLEEGGAQYNMFVAYELLGELSLKSFKKAWQVIVERHESFRTAFVEVNGEGYQIVSPYKNDLFKIEFKKINEKASERELEKLAHAEAQKPFDLSSSPLLRVTVLQLSKTHNLLFISMHHIISDGWSFNLLTQELETLYSAFLRGMSNPLEERSIDYLDYTIWQSRWLQSEAIEKQLHYHLLNLKDIEGPLLPLRNTQPVSDNPNQGNRIQFQLDKTITLKLKALAGHADTTLFNVLISAFSVLIFNYTDQKDFLIATPSTGRHYPGVERIFGFFVNILLLKFSSSHQLNFYHYLQKNHAYLMEVFSNQDLPFERLVEALNPDRSLVGSSLTRVMFAFQNFYLNPFSLSDLGVEPFCSDNHTFLLADYENTKFDLSVYVQENEGILQGAFEYNINLIEEDLARRMMGNFITLLTGLCEGVDDPICFLNSIAPLEKNDLIRYSTGMSSRYSEESLDEYFQAVANNHPNATAVCYLTEKISYAELNNLSNKVANYLSDKIRLEEKVGVLTDRSIISIALMLGLLKVGGVYLPIDKSLPEARIKYIVENSQVKVLFLTKELYVQYKALFNSINNEILIIEDIFPQITQLKGQLEDERSILAENPAYVVYTSGTTGKPKGVVQTHKTIINLIRWQSTQAETSHQRVVAQFASIGFDVSMQEVFYALLNGFKLTIIPDNLKIEPHGFFEYLNQQGVQVLFIPTAFLELLCQEWLKENSKLLQLEEIIVAGEQLKISKSVKEFFMVNKHIKLINHYGPSETHVVTSFEMPREPSDWESLPVIGKPINNSQVYVLNPSKQICPLGVSGEIYIGGDGLAQGYLNDPSYTQDKFAEIYLQGIGLKKLYKTGDVGFWDKNGNLNYVGRQDYQIKIRGYRVEPAEIELHALDYPGISKAAVLVSSDEYGFNALDLFYVLYDSEVNFNLLKFKDYLKNSLPGYMSPRKLIQVDELSLTQNGKIDKRFLVEASGKIEESSQENIVLSETQQSIVKIYSKLLNLDQCQININDSFFDMGGYSLLAIKAVNLLNKELSANLSVKDFLSNSSVKSLDEILNEKIDKDKGSRILITLREGSSPIRLVLIHPIGGTVFCYQKLVEHIDPNISCYAIQDPSIEAKSPMFASVKEMARHYADVILQDNFSGTYCLAGYSFGGLVANEIASILKMAGKNVALTALLDSWVVHNLQEQKLKRVLESFKKDLISIEDDVSQEWLDLYETRFKQAVDHVPTDSHTNIILFKSNNLLLESMRKEVSANFWDYYTSTLKVVKISASHQDIIKEPFVDAIGKYINQLLPYAVSAHGHHSALLPLTEAIS